MRNHFSPFLGTGGTNTYMMTEESPHKVMGLLAAALLSMSFLFAVAVTDMPMQGNSPVAFPDTFSPEHVVSMLQRSDPFSPEHVIHTHDVAMQDYSGFLTSYLIAPALHDSA